VNRPIAGWALATALALLTQTGCAAGLRLKQIDAAQEKPANVLLFFRINAGHDGVPGLEESAFTVKEDDHVVGPGVDRVIVNPDLRAAQATMVLVDLGGRPSSEDLEALSSAATALVERLGAGRRVALYAVDGLEQPQPLAPFGASLDALKGAAAKIPAYKTRDPSLDLNGGYISALHTLKQATPPSNGPRIANLVLLARGPDRASRVDLRAVRAEVEKTDIDVTRFVVGFGPEAAAAKLDTFADGSPVLAPNAEALREAAIQVGEAIDDRGRSFYLLSYCTVARGGEHKVKLEVSRERPTPKGKPEVQTGSLQYSFHADGFGPGCTPNVPDGWKSEPMGTGSLPRASSDAHLDRSRGGPKPALAGAIPVR
jgi:hypothetical protein